MIIFFHGDSVYHQTHLSENKAIKMHQPRQGQDIDY